MAVQGAKRSAKQRLAGMLSRGFAKRQRIQPEANWAWWKTVTHYRPEPWPTARQSMALHRYSMAGARMSRTGA